MNNTFTNDVKDFFIVPISWCSGKAVIYFNWLKTPYYMDGIPGSEYVVCFTNGMAWFLRILTITLLAIGNACLVFFTAKLWQFYRERWCNLSLKVLLATLTTILVFGRTIREHIPINLLLIFLVIQIVYLGVLRYCDDFFANRNLSDKWDKIQKAW